MAEDRALSPAEVESLVAMIRGSRTRQTERVTAVEAGVRTAAEQVQDVRLQLLEAPPPIDLADLALQVGLTLVFETAILGYISARASRALLSPLARAEQGAQRALRQVGERRAQLADEVRSAWLRTRRVYPRAASTSGSSAVAQTLERNVAPALQAMQATERTYLQLAVDAERAASTHARLRSLLGNEGENVGGAIQAATAGWQAANKAGPGTAPAGPAALEPGAELQSQAAAWSAGWRAGINDRHDAFEQVARSPECPLKVGQDIASALDPTEDLGAALAGIREATSITVEGIIWSRLYAEKLPAPSRFDDLARFAGPRPVEDTWRMVKGLAQGRGTADAIVKSDIDGRLRDYLGRRFGPYVEAGDPVVAGAKRPSDTNQVWAAMRQSRVLRWLADVNDRYADADRQLTSLLTSR
jgi:hypothetical protein